MITQQQAQELIADGLRVLSFPMGGWEPAPSESAAPDDVTRWHQIALEGEWDGHWQGAFSLCRRDFEQMIQHSRTLSNDIVVDYEHNSLNFFAEKNPAAGWITDLRMRDTEQGSALFARIRWTDAASTMIRAGEYRYVSPTILWRTTDRKTGTDLGTSLHSVALTNTPFLDELPELRINSSMIASMMAARKETEPMIDNEKVALAAVLGLPPASDFETLMTHIREMQTDAGGIEQIANACGLQGAKLESIVITCQAMREEIDQLRPRAAKASELEAAASVRQARDEGKIVASNEQWASDLARSNPEVFSSWAASAPKIVPTDIKVPASSKQPSGSDDFERLCKNPDVIAEAKKAGLSVEAYVRPNVKSLAKQYA